MQITTAVEQGVGKAVEREASAAVALDWDVSGLRAMAIKAIRPQIASAKRHTIALTIRRSITRGIPLG